jgi:hypothetical protein
MPPARITACGQAARAACQTQIELQGHSRRRDADDIPAPAAENPVEIGANELRAQVRVEDFDVDAARCEEALQPPHAQGGREERELTAVRIVGSDEQQLWNVDGVSIGQSAPLRIDFHGSYRLAVVRCDLV